MRAGTTPIDFHKRARGRYHSLLHRFDGVSVRLEGGTYIRVGGQVGRWWTPSCTAEAVERACADLDEAAERWGALVEGATLRMTWPRSASPPRSAYRK